MALEIEGKIIQKLNVQKGQSARGTWAKQEFILEFQEGNFPSSVCLSVWGEDKVRDLERFQVGDRVKVSFNISSREYNGKWYTDVRAWRIETPSASGYQQSGYAGGFAPTGATESNPHSSAPDAAAASTGYGLTGAGAPMPTADDMSAPLSDNGEDDLPF